MSTVSTCKTLRVRIRRSDRRELRMCLDEFRGKHYVGLREWYRDGDGRWWPTPGKGINLRVSEALAVAENLLAVVESLERPEMLSCPPPLLSPLEPTVRRRPRLATGA